MDSISESRLLTTSPVGLADPGRFAAKAAAPASVVQTAEAAVRSAEAPRPAPETVASETAAPGTGTDTKPHSAQIHRRFARFETMDYTDGIPDRDFAFGDLLDIVNPLQHIPVISSLYRNLTGDEISGPAKIMGGLLYGGPVGFVAALAVTIAEQEAGQDLGEAALAALFGGEESSDVLLAERDADVPDAPADIPDRVPARPAAILAAIPAATPVAATAADTAAANAAPIITAAGAEPQAALSGQDALDAFVRDIKGGGHVPSIGGIDNAAAIEVMPLPPLPALAPPAPLAQIEARQRPNPQVVENVRIGAIEPGPLGWTVQRRAEPAATAPAPPPSAAPADPLAADPLAADPLAEAAEISGRAFSERMLQALDKYQAMNRAEDAKQTAAVLDVQL